MKPFLDCIVFVKDNENYNTISTRSYVLTISDLLVGMDRTWTQCMNGLFNG